MVVTGQVPAATLLIKFGDQPAFKKIENVSGVEKIRASFAFQKTKLLTDMRMVDDSSHVTYSQESLNLYKGMKIFKNEVVKNLLEDPAIVSKTGNDERIVDLVALKKKCVEGGLAPGDIEILINTLKNSH